MFSCVALCYVLLCIKLFCHPGGLEIILEFTAFLSIKLSSEDYIYTCGMLYILSFGRIILIAFHHRNKIQPDSMQPFRANLKWHAGNGK